MIKATLRCRIASSNFLQLFFERERLHHRKICPYQSEWIYTQLLLFNNLPFPTLKKLLYGCKHAFRACYFTHINRLKKIWRAVQFARIVQSTSSRHDLSASTMNSITHEFTVRQVKAISTYFFFYKHSVLGGPLPSPNQRISDFIDKRCTCSHIDQQISTVIFWPERPYFCSFLCLPVKVFAEDCFSLLGALLRSNSLRFDCSYQSLLERFTVSVEPIVLVW